MEESSLYGVACRAAAGFLLGGEEQEVISFKHSARYWRKKVRVR